MTLEQLYQQAIGPLPLADRFRLATMILNQIPPQSFIDDRDEWTGEDIDDVLTYSANASSLEYPEDDNLVDPR